MAPLSVEDRTDMLPAGWSSPRTGVRAFDNARFHGTPVVGAHWATCDGFGALHQIDVGAREVVSPPGEDHVAFVLLAPVPSLTVEMAGQRSCARGNRHDVAIIPAGVGSRWLADSPCPTLHLHLSPERLVEMAEGADLPAEFELLPRIAARDQRIVQIAEAVLAEMSRPTVGSKAMMESLALAFGVALLRGHSTLAVTPSSERITLAPFRLKRVVDFIEANLGNDIGLKELSSAAGLSAYHFSRAFKQATGVSPCRYLTERRVSHARDLLSAGTLPIVQVASACGFTSQQHFTETFRRSVGVPPGRYRKMHNR